MRYELLNEGDYLKEGDEFYSVLKAEWVAFDEGNFGGRIYENHDVCRRPLKSPWVRLDDRRPTLADTDKHGQVIVSFKGDDSVCECDWNEIDEREVENWMSVPPIPKPKPDFQRDYVDTLEGVELKLWNLVGEETKNNIRTAWEKLNL